jgi:hypothetical protein
VASIAELAANAFVNAPSRRYKDTGNAAAPSNFARAPRSRSIRSS